jgi:hypothetical protein
VKKSSNSFLTFWPVSSNILIIKLGGRLLCFFWSLTENGEESPDFPQTIDGLRSPIRAEVAGNTRRPEHPQGWRERESATETILTLVFGLRPKVKS